MSIQNVVRMSLIFDRNPGEWHGNNSISQVFSHLFKIYKPIQNFEICLFVDENVQFDKIDKAGKSTSSNWLAKQKFKFEDLSDERKEKYLLIDALFSKYLK